ncbi:DUF421 domain-containing protein [Brevibacterium daeguense]|uniref:DUF421 domain-containing protein n=1 Tax=Brevibacterium daeguense TaxID=909936 RepID=A0ABP8EK56_9MICO|nr:YetF domain-containing protein [Brevibacterium daeguense]
MNWSDWLTPSMSVLELVARGTITFLLLYILIRIVGRRESGGVGVTDLLVVVLIADAASTGMTGDSQTIADGFILVVVILFWSIVIDALGYRFPRFARLLKSGPQPLIVDGKLVRRTMRREFITYEEVMSQLRLQGLEDPSEVQRAYIEPNGSFSIVTKKQAADEPPGSHQHDWGSDQD